MTNFANFDMLSPGSMAFKHLLNANWALLDSMCVTERVLTAGYFWSAGQLIAFDAAGGLITAQDSASYNLERKIPVGFAMNDSGWGDTMVLRMMGIIETAQIDGSPSIGDTLYLSETIDGSFSATPGPNAVACGIYTGGTTVLFRPRLKVVS